MFGSDWDALLAVEDSQRLGLYSACARQMSDELLNKTIESINAMIEPLIHKPLLGNNNEQITLNVEESILVRLTDPTIFRDSQHPYASYLNDIVRIEDAARDNFLLSSIYQAQKEGRELLVVFGGSHIIALKPALDSLYLT